MLNKKTYSNQVLLITLSVIIIAGLGLTFIQYLHYSHSQSESAQTGILPEKTAETFSTPATDENTIQGYSSAEQLPDGENEKYTDKLLQYSFYYKNSPIDPQFVLSSGSTPRQRLDAYNLTITAINFDTLNPANPVASIKAEDFQCNSQGPGMNGDTSTCTNDDVVYFENTYHTKGYRVFRTMIFKNSEGKVTETLKDHAIVFLLPQPIANPQVSSIVYRAVLLYSGNPTPDNLTQLDTLADSFHF